MTSSYRIAIVGAASIRGKQLNEALAESSFAASEFLLMDDEQALGQLEAVGDEITFIQPITADSFDRVDFTFFAGTAELTRRHWQAAHKAGSSIVDLSAGLEGEPGVLVCAPWVQEAIGEGAVAGAPTLHTPAVFPPTLLRWCSPYCWSVCSELGPFARSRPPYWSRLRNMAGLRWTSCISRR